MKCPNCNGRLITSDTEYTHDGYDVFRRRKCNKCKYVAYTAEVEVEYEGEYQDEWRRCKLARKRRYAKKKEEK